MKTITFTALLLVCLISQGQELISPDEAGKARIMSAVIHSPEGEEISFSDLINRKHPTAVLFAFKGCFGCKLSIEETLIPNYEVLKESLGMEIYIVSKEGKEERNGAVDYYRDYPFHFYFDERSSLYMMMPPVPLSDGRILKAFPTLVIFNNDCSYVSVDPFRLDSIIDACNILTNKLVLEQGN